MKKPTALSAALTTLCTGGLILFACSAQTTAATPSTATASTTAANCQARTANFKLAGDQASTRCEGDHLIVESSGLSEEQMMVGITAWQQQVPLPQPYTGNNAWKIPLVPVAASTPTATSGVGAVGVALNGVPIFNPSKPSQGGNQEVYDPANDPKLIGELDNCGGHSGRGDDYHYHAGPECLLKTVGDTTGGVIGYALDGYTILEFKDADGKVPADLDTCNGHDHDGLGYHYHLTEEEPYVIGCFHGDVAGAFQPQTLHLRPAGGPLKATITALDTGADGWTNVKLHLRRPEADRELQTGGRLLPVPVSRSRPSQFAGNRNGHVLREVQVGEDKFLETAQRGDGTVKVPSPFHWPR